MKTQLALPTSIDTAGPSVQAPWVLASLSLAMLLSSLGTSSANVGLPAIAQAFSAPFQAVQWIVIAYLLSITSLVVSVGKLGDIVGRRRLMLVGLSVFAIASLFCGIAPTLILLIAARAAQGIGAAIMMALAVAMVGGLVPKQKIGSAMGLLGTMSAVGTALGPSLGGTMIAALGWRSIFLVNVPLGIVAVVLARHALPGDRPIPRVDRPAFDVLGTIVLVLMLTAYTLAMTTGRGHFGSLNAILLSAAVAGGVLFVLVEKKAASPLIWSGLFRDRAMRASLATSMLVASVMMTTLVVGPFHLARALGLDAAAIGLLMSVGPLAAAMTGVPAGRLVDCFGARGMTLAGLLGMASACLALSLIPASAGVAGYVVPLAVMTIGYAIFQAANTTGVMTSIDPAQRGVISGMLNLSRNLGLVTGASVLGAVFAYATGASDVTHALPQTVEHGTRTTFAVATALIIAAFVLAIAKREREPVLTPVQS